MRAWCPRTRRSCGTPCRCAATPFALPDHGPREDTAVVPPGRILVVDFDADRPGPGMVHCHHVHHRKPARRRSSAAAGTTANGSRPVPRRWPVARCAVSPGPRPADRSP
ncbi:multicopper oxidase domain-containing protein [Streptomyces sp. NPDC005931]|uniref:multicopper oxidase domain-containing protein n=1 Tax=Streptomyces sp. NPDC005931 TaxID=3364737 RepID=UPI0036C61111